LRAHFGSCPSSMLPCELSKYGACTANTQPLFLKLSFIRGRRPINESRAPSWPTPVGSQLVCSHWRPSDGPTDILCSAKSWPGSLSGLRRPRRTPTPPRAPPLSANGPSPRALRLAGSGPLTFKFFFRRGAGFSGDQRPGARVSPRPALPAPSGS
jgi:hypothetical protein